MKLYIDNREPKEIINYIKYLIDESKNKLFISIEIKSLDLGDYIIYDEKYELMYHVGNRDRFYLDFKDIPNSMINAIISAEDKTFFQHQGFDIKGIINAFIINIKNIYSKNNNNYVGASTITQQLVKNILLN